MGISAGGREVRPCRRALILADGFLERFLQANDAAFTRLLAYTGHEAHRLIQAIPSLAPATFTRPGEPPALRVASLRDQMLDCPQCRLRRDGAYIDTSLFPLQMACLRHGYWLHRDGAHYRLPPAVMPEITAAQNRLSRLATRRGKNAAVHAYGIATGTSTTNGTQAPRRPGMPGCASVGTGGRRPSRQRTEPRGFLPGQYIPSAPP